MNKIIDKLIAECEEYLREEFQRAEEVALYNQEKVLDAFIKNRVSATHFCGTIGYGYGDAGRESLARVFADIFHAESAIVSPFFASGTHAISIALRGLMRPQMSLLSITGKPYDTLDALFFGKNVNSLNDFGITCDYIDTIAEQIDTAQVTKRLNVKKYEVIYIQRSGGYSERSALSIAQIRDAIALVKSLSFDSIVFVDNCYGEFVDVEEPTDAGADIVVGSLIKNPGGGLASCGAYIVGAECLIRQISYIFTAPLIGSEIGSYAPGYREFFQGLFLAPHTVLQAAKGAFLLSEALKRKGYATRVSANKGDIICAANFPDEQSLIKFCQTIQAFSPVDSYVTPVPWDMPGYNHKVIMAAGCFVQGSSIELSCDSPIRPPYTAYIQGGLTYEHIKIVLKKYLSEL